MNIQIILKNYRCFSDTKPARIELRKGFTSLIGINNSGKSALLKFFYEFRFILRKLDQVNFWNSLVSNQQLSFDLPKEVLDSQEVFCNFNDRPLIIELKFLPILDLEFEGAKIPAKIEIVVQRTGDIRGRLFLKDTKPLDSKGAVFIDRQILENGEVKVEIPLPFLNSLAFLGQTTYIGPFRNAINLFSVSNLSQLQNLRSGHVQYFDIEVGVSFISRWREIKTGSNKKLAKKAYELQEDIQRIFGFEDLDINASSNLETLQFKVGEEIYGLSEIGSGLCQLFMILANVIINQSSYILIDEPEMNLHPSLQLDFLTTLGNYAEQGILFSTHSMGLARACSEQIYTIRKTKQGSEVIEFERMKNATYLSELLGELSFAAYREIGFNKLLLVEGPTDVKTVQQFLRKYRKDHEILLLSLGGSSLINSSFKNEINDIKRITEHIYVLIDSEKLSSEEQISEHRKRFLDFCQDSNIECHVLKYRAIENYFPDRAVKMAIGERFSALTPYEKIAHKGKLGWSKSDNWRMAKEMTIEELSKTDLGKFLEKLINQ